MEPTEENIRAFDALHRARQEPDELPAIVARTLGDLKKKKVLHLLCGTGEATAALAELGAIVTGLDPRHQSLEAARERWPKILWVDGDLQDISRPLARRKFDLVYSGEGVLDRIDDLSRWAAGIAGVLKPGGELLVFDDHPVAECVDGLLRWGGNYFRDPSDPNRLWRLDNFCGRDFRQHRGQPACPTVSDQSVGPRRELRVETATEHRCIEVDPKEIHRVSFQF